MSKVSMTVKQIVELGLWDKVAEYLGINLYALNEGQISDDEVLTFDTEFKKHQKDLPREFVGECFILRNNEGEFCYGECSGNGNDFDEAYKWNDEEDVYRFINHNREYNNEDWKVLRIRINYKIIELWQEN